jgi:hypothetical protein
VTSTDRDQTIDRQAHSVHELRKARIADDVDDARVYGGIHFRFEQEVGGRFGRDVATEVYKNNLRPRNGAE